MLKQTFSSLLVCYVIRRCVASFVVVGHVWTQFEALLNGTRSDKEFRWPENWRVSQVFNFDSWEFGGNSFIELCFDFIPLASFPGQNSIFVQQPEATTNLCNLNYVKASFSWITRELEGKVSHVNKVWQNIFRSEINSVKFGEYFGLANVWINSALAVVGLQHGKWTWEALWKLNEKSMGELQFVGTCRTKTRNASLIWNSFTISRTSTNFLKFTAAIVLTHE